MAPVIPPLDEQEFDQPALIGGLPNQDLHAGNNLFWYFTSSPWFEPSCININVYLALQHQQDQMFAQQVMNDPKLWNERLKGVPEGTQFIISGEGQAEGHPWLLQRQNKRENDEGVFETHVEGNFYTQGSKMFMAPSLLDVVQSRLLTVSTRMQQMAELSKNMTHWSPATGYSYFPPSYEAAKTATSPTVAPTDPDAAASQSQSAAATAQATDAVASTTEFSDALFMHSLNLTNAFGDEFMDENPLKGEPGAFVFEGTRTAVKARNKAQEQAAQAIQLAPVAAKADTQPPSVAPSVAATPMPVATPTAAQESQSRKGSVAPAPKKKKDRRKSQAGPASPVTQSGA
ncbi:hypothetical protein EJ02DRAFT_443405 [Clathrospora elynae]|uniref:Mediator of RNA polymerase II transcription subunit 6 n=1 Tax=Clathrospora elynae TaxID=706981 RepID=A0A6A5SXT5_9PLEO|nr:hypothetical protein EJ02DRAFT_443405 [Clathrospora elynae]